MKLLNLGCGNKFHSDWVNVDFKSGSPEVIQADLSKSVPFSDCDFNVIYHSHLLEHFSHPVAEHFLHECHRVLQPDGILRVVVPDLEGIVRTYLKKLDAVVSGDSSSESDYDWMMLELYDQTVRTTPGGAMKQYLAQEIIPNRAFITARTGWLRELPRMHEEQPSAPKKAPHRWRRFLSFSTYREKLLGLLLGDEYPVFLEGRFRHSGEIHAWMYDRFSLGRLLSKAGFTDIRQCAANESGIPNWAQYLLDTEEDGSIRKPDSLFMECRKPS